MIYYIYIILHFLIFVNSKIKIYYLSSSNVKSFESNKFIKDILIMLKHAQTIPKKYTNLLPENVIKQINKILTIIAFKLNEFKVLNNSIK